MNVKEEKPKLSCTFTSIVHDQVSKYCQIFNCGQDEQNEHYEHEDDEQEATVTIKRLMWNAAVERSDVHKVFKAIDESFTQKQSKRLAKLLKVNCTALDTILEAWISRKKVNATWNKLFLCLKKVDSTHWTKTARGCAPSFRGLCPQKEGAQPRALEEGAQSPALEEGTQPPALVEEGAHPPTLEERTQPPALDGGAQHPTLEEGAQSLALEEGTQPSTLEEGTQPPTLEEGTQPPALAERSQPPTLEEGAQPPTLDEKLISALMVSFSVIHMYVFIVMQVYLCVCVCVCICACVRESEKVNCIINSRSVAIAIISILIQKLGLTKRCILCLFCAYVKN